MKRIYLYICVVALSFPLHKLNAQNELDSIIEVEFLKAQVELLSAEHSLDSAKWAEQSLVLKKINEELRTQLNEKTNLLEEQIRVLHQKETLFTEKEQVYKEAINNSNIDKAKVEGLLATKNESIAGKEKEIIYLEKSITDKDKNIAEKDRQLFVATTEKDKYSQMTDTLREKLVTAEKELLKRDEELKYTKQRASEAEAKIAQATNRKKKVRVIQGISMRFYPIPEWDIMPYLDENKNLHNQIINRNDGYVEFDFITGASVMLFDFTKPNSKFSSDLGFYVGFGGQNLFKNFYTGASYKFLDFFHLTAGINIAQYQVLAGNQYEGYPLEGAEQIQLKKQWKVTPFISLSLDLDFLSYIGKK
ncbi:MAG: hypothetical protein LBR17_04815 [Bacteroidales bacterium]|jgi:hypothetical protein|nr:hypothetical protein [Bacteroidales bacterium]